MGSRIQIRQLQIKLTLSVTEKRMVNPTSADLSLYLEAAHAACDGAGKILNSYFGNLRHVDEKYQAGLVSEADKESEKFIVGLLRERFPDHSFLGEETGLSGSSSSQVNTSIPGKNSSGQVLWMIDPLDGTTNYIHQFPFFCISIGLEIGGELVVGVVDAPKLGVRWHAVKGGGAFVTYAGQTPERIHVSSRKEFRDGLYSTGFSAYDEKLDQQLDLITIMIRDTRGIRRAGAAALDLCYVAQGVFDAFWEKYLAPWDTAAGVVIAKEAGAIATDMDGNAFDPRMRSVLVAQPALHGEVLGRIEMIRQQLKP
jgi:myo-inositol-1(or 4)-monophosphatase